MQASYAVDDFNVILRIVRATDAIYPLMSPDENFGRLGQYVALLRDAIEMPPHFICVAYSSARPKSATAEDLEALITTRLGQFAA